ncbi:hypothetical protein ACPPVU_09040 [Mucilaginibacter sp. McL0603]|uniref:hypothetical protein n=1 Tax=Mucilaginibacter sp. McL0603 TaxID=3415670 RepID=UPI003CF158DD
MNLPAGRQVLNIERRCFYFIIQHWTFSGFIEAAYSQNATVKLFSNDKMEIIYDDIVTENGITERDLEVTYMTKQN